MKATTIVCAIAALALNLSGFAYAQGNPRADDNPQGQQRGHAQGAHPGPAHAQGNQRAPMRNAQRGHYGPGAGPDHNFYRGGRLPPQYRSHQYVVNDWRGHHLNAPPRGYQWVQTGADYVLVAIVSGVIAQILLSH